MYVSKVKKSVVVAPESLSQEIEDAVAPFVGCWPAIQRLPDALLRFADADHDGNISAEEWATFKELAKTCRTGLNRRADQARQRVLGNPPSEAGFGGPPAARLMVFWVPDSWSGLEMALSTIRAELPRTTRQRRGSRLARAPSTAPRTRCAVRRSRWQELYGLLLWSRLLYKYYLHREIILDSARPARAT